MSQGYLCIVEQRIHEPGVICEGRDNREKSERVGFIDQTSCSVLKGIKSSLLCHRSLSG